MNRHQQIFAALSVPTEKGGGRKADTLVSVGEFDVKFMSQMAFAEFHLSRCQPEQIHKLKPRPPLKSLLGPRSW